MTQTELPEMHEKFQAIFPNGVPNFRTLPREDYFKLLEDAKSIKFKEQSPEQHQADLLEFIFRTFDAWSTVGGSYVMDTAIAIWVKDYATSFLSNEKTRAQGMQLLSLLAG